MRRRFGRINALQWLGIGLVVAAALAGRVPELIPGLVAVVVGLHFLPLAALFQQPRFHLTGALMISVGAAGCAVSAAGGPANAARMAVGLGAAAVLWGTACLARHAPTGPGTEGHTQTT
jgi:hypothetical protein